MPSGKYLTTREKERILELRAEGLTVMQVATRLGINPQTIRAVYRRNKMGQILLSVRELSQATYRDVGMGFGKQKIGNCCQEAIKAQLKKVRGKIAVVEIPEGKSAGYNVDGKPYIALAMLEEDWQALLKEVEE